MANHEQSATLSAPEDQVSKLTHMQYGIADREREGISKHIDRFAKRHAMLAQIVARLRWIPFELDHMQRRGLRS